MLIALFIFLVLAVVGHLFGLIDNAIDPLIDRFGLLQIFFHLFMMIAAIVLTVLVVVKL